MLKGWLIRRKNHEGASAVEFALVAPILFVLIFGIIEFGLIMFVSSVVEGATSTAARLAKTGADRSQAESAADRANEDGARIRATILDRGAGIIKDEKLNVIITPMSGGSPGTVGESGEMVVYEVTYNWQVLTPIISNLITQDDGIYPVSSMAVVVNEPFADDPTP